MTGYWIVDLDARLVERWQQGEERPEILRETLTWQPPGSSKPVKISLPTFFSEMLDI
ncbi:MAG TPA: hypothetical protein VHR41_12780 [Gemmatimonadales bacterium]|nr:hypothetical protein [Gemmatimonadales bacterium]